MAPRFVSTNIPEAGMQVDELSEEQLKLITDFFDEYYKSLKELKEYDLTKFFVDVDSDDPKDINMTLQIIDYHGIKPLYTYRSLNNGIHIILDSV
mgnify:CR=1 FL=1